MRITHNNQSADIERMCAIGLPSWGLAGRHRKLSPTKGLTTETRMPQTLAPRAAHITTDAMYSQLLHVHGLNIIGLDVIEKYSLICFNTCDEVHV